MTDAIDYDSPTPYRNTFRERPTVPKSTTTR